MLAKYFRMRLELLCSHLNPLSLFDAHAHSFIEVCEVKRRLACCQDNPLCEKEMWKFANL